MRGEHITATVRNENFFRYTENIRLRTHCSEQFSYAHVLLSTMEALAAISLASNVAQFVEYAIQFTKLAYKFASSDSGPISQHEGIKEITTSMTEAMKEINHDSTDSTLSSLAGQCIAVATTVQNIVSDLSKKPDDNLIRSLHKAGKTLHKQKELQELSNLLSTMRAQVSQRLLVLIRSVLVSSRQMGWR